MQDNTFRGSPGMIIPSIIVTRDFVFKQDQVLILLIKHLVWNHLSDSLMKEALQLNPANLVPFRRLNFIFEGFDYDKFFIRTSVPSPGSLWLLSSSAS